MNNEIEVKISNNYVNYKSAVSFMEKRVKGILNGKEKELIWFLNHNHIYTCGTSAKNNEILLKNNIPIVKTNRGGKTTYHGPGQRIVYLIINLNNRKKDIRKFINLIEKSSIQLLDDLGITAKIFPKKVGIWVTGSREKQYKNEKKIGAIGLRVKKWITYHGLSFNINTNLEYYNSINACGIKNLKSTSLKELNCKITYNEFDSRFLKIFLNDLKSL